MFWLVKGVIGVTEEILKYAGAIEEFFPGNRDENHKRATHNHEGERPKGQHIKWPVILKKRTNK